MIGVPSLSVTQPGRSGEPTRMARRILLPAMAEVATSKSIGASRRAGRGDGNGIGAEQGLGAEGGNHGEARRGEADAHHVVLGSLHGVVADRAEVPAVVHGHHADAHGLRLLDGQAHGLGPDHDAEAPLRVDHRGAGSLAHQPVSRLGLELARLVVLDVHPQHVRHAVRLDAAEVGHGQHVGALRGVLGAHAQLLEDLRHRPAQCRFGDADDVFRGNLEALEDHASLLRWRDVQGHAITRR